MSNLKKFGIAILILLLIACLGIDIWYLYISLYGNERVVANTFEVGLQKLNDGSTKYFVEVNSMADLFEIKFNYLLDENKESFFSQGLQFVADDSGNINFYFNEEMDEKYQQVINQHGWWLWSEGTYNRFVYGVKGDTTYNYMSSDDYESVQLSTNEISNNSRFKITLGEDTYLMAFKGYNIGYTHFADNYSSQNTWGSLMYWNVNRYYSSDVYYFAKLIYDSLKSVENGTSSPHVFEFGDLFNYYEYDESTGVYDKLVNLDKAHSITKDVRSYYSILFKCVAGNSNFKVDGDYSTDDYFVGRDVKVLNINHFAFVEVSENNYALKLRGDFIEKYEKYFDKMFFRIEIDLDYFAKKNYNFTGFTSDSGLEKMKYKEIYTLKTQDGEKVKSVVTL